MGADLRRAEPLVPLLGEANPCRVCYLLGRWAGLEDWACAWLRRCRGEKNTRICASKEPSNPNWPGHRLRAWLILVARSATRHPACSHPASDRVNRGAGWAPSFQLALSSFESLAWLLALFGPGHACKGSRSELLQQKRARVSTRLTRTVLAMALSGYRATCKHGRHVPG